KKTGLSHCFIWNKKCSACRYTFYLQSNCNLMFYKRFCWFLGCSADMVFGDGSVFQAFGFLSMNSGCDSGYFFAGCPVPDSEGVIPSMNRA
ncbi:hypothetical protein M2O40_004620, partial [Kluyvera ascorbata]